MNELCSLSMTQTVKQTKQTDTDHELLVFCIFQNHPAVMRTLQLQTLTKRS